VFFLVPTHPDCTG